MELRLITMATRASKRPRCAAVADTVSKYSSWGRGGGGRKGRRRGKGGGKEGGKEGGRDGKRE